MFTELLDQIVSLPLVFDGAVRPPASEPSLRDAETRCRVRLPDDLRTMLRRFNGTTGPTDLDHGWLTFWRAEDLEIASTAAGYEQGTDLLVFADHGLSSWWYALEGARSDGQSSRVYMLAHEPEVVAHSLADFLRAVVDGDARLYGRGDAG